MAWLWKAGEISQKTVFLGGFQWWFQWILTNNNGDFNGSLTQKNGDLVKTNVINMYIYIFFWTPLKNISQMGLLFPIYGKIKNGPNHQPVYIIYPLVN
jgi:hypothetical protein